MAEFWKDIKDYEGFYEVSNKGNVRNFNTKQILSPSKSNKGYNHVILCKNKVQKGIGVHRLVALNFLPNPQNKPQVNHINGIKTDNRVENLEWVTCSENIIHSYKAGKQRMGWDRELINRNAKSHYKKVRAIEIDKVFDSITKASQELNICLSSISNCLHKRIQTAGGYHWEFMNEVLNENTEN